MRELPEPRWPGNRLRRQITASGSPFRYLRKGSLYLARPLDSLRRISGVTDATRDFSPDLRSKLDAMKSTGYADAAAETDPVLLAELDALCQDRLVQNPDLQSKMAYWANLTGPADRTADGILVRFALQEQVLKLATAYFGQVPYWRMSISPSHTRRASRSGSPPNSGTAITRIRRIKNHRSQTHERRPSNLTGRWKTRR